MLFFVQNILEFEPNEAISINRNESEESDQIDIAILYSDPLYQVSLSNNGNSQSANPVPENVGFLVCQNIIK